MSQMSEVMGPTGRLACFGFCWQTTKRLMATERSSYYRNRTSFWRSIYAFAEHTTFSAWVRFLNSPGNEVFRDADRLVWYKPLRGYLHKDWTASRRLKVLKETYGRIRNEAGLERDVFVRRANLVLAMEALGEDEGDVVIEINHQQRFKREGELSLSIVCERHGGELASIAFSYEETAAGLVAYAGGVQGGAGASPATIKSSTKAMHGLRPKALAVMALQWYLASRGVVRILGVGDAAHMSHVKHLIKTRWNRISFSYDQLWIESGGTPIEAGWYELPLSPRRKERSEIKPNKRALYARRYELMGRISKAMALATGRTEKSKVLVNEPSMCR